MKIINKYILDELKGPIILAVFVFTFIFLLDIVVTMMEHIIVKGISVFDFLRLLSFYIPPILTQTIPIGMFLGIMICFTKFSRNSESVAMVSTGMSIRAILKPILAIAIGAAIFIVFLQESIIPRSFVKLKYVGTKIAYENPVFQLKEKTFIDNLDGYSIYVDEVDSDGKAKNVIAFEKPKDKNKFSLVLTGEEAFWKDSAIILKESQFVSFDENGKKNLIGTFDENRIILKPSFQELNIKIKDVEALSITDLIKNIRKVDAEEALRYKIEIFRKLALIFSTVPLAVIGFCLSLGHHRISKKYSFVLAMIIIFAYIIFLNIGIVIASAGKLHPFIATWTPNVLLYFLGYKLYKAKEVRGI
jgi:hypothetical protein